MRRTRRERRNALRLGWLRSRQARGGVGVLVVALLAALHALWPTGTQVLETSGPVTETTRRPPVAKRATTSSTSTTTTAAPVTTASTTKPTTTTTTTPTTATPPPPAAPPVTACVPAPLPAPPRWGPDPSRYDAATVQATPDPDEAGCGRTRLLVVGDSIGRGAANGLKRLGRQDFEIWDRTEHGCGLVPESAKCPGWRNLWSDAVARIDPDVVLVYLGVSGKLGAGEGPPFHSPEAVSLRRTVLDSAMTMLSAKGATVVWALPAVPLPNAAFFCGGSIADTPCDRTWTDRWHQDVNAVATARGIRTIDLRTWVDGQRGSVQPDRPDGLHMTGPALDAHAPWLLAQLQDLIG